LPRTRNAPGIRDADRGIAVEVLAVAIRPEAFDLEGERRTGESHGKIVWARLVLSTPERP
jgi:hypothetical protein